MNWQRVVVTVLASVSIALGNALGPSSPWGQVALVVGGALGGTMTKQVGASNGRVRR